jgi:hypothetical protein
MLWNCLQFPAFLHSPALQIAPPLCEDGDTDADGTRRFRIRRVSYRESIGVEGSISIQEHVVW